jgi:hypothetical protein
MHNGVKSLPRLILQLSHRHALRQLRLLDTSINSSVSNASKVQYVFWQQTISSIYFWIVLKGRYI